MPFTVSTQRTACSPTLLRRLLVVAGLVSGVTAFAVGLVGQGVPKLTVVSPRPGFVAHPGTHLTVVVVPSKGSAFVMVGLLGSSSLMPGENVRRAPPWRFTFTVQEDIPAAGRYRIVAAGATAPGHPVYSAPIYLDVEPSEAPSALKARGSLLFQRVGEDLPLSVTACFSHAPPMDVTKSTRITYTSSDKSVVVVNSTGYATSTGRGAAVVVVKFGDKTIIVPISVE